MKFCNREIGETYDAIILFGAFFLHQSHLSFLGPPSTIKRKKVVPLNGLAPLKIEHFVYKMHSFLLMRDICDVIKMAREKNQ